MISMSNCYPLRKAKRQGPIFDPRRPTVGSDHLVSHGSQFTDFLFGKTTKTTFVTSRRLRELRFPRSNICRWCWFYHEVIVWSINNKSTPTESLNMEISTLAGWGPTKIDWYMHQSFNEKTGEILHINWVWLVFWTMRTIFFKNSHCFLYCPQFGK